MTENKKTKVLLVDDDQDALDSLRAVMEQFGCETFTLDSGVKAIEFVRECQVDVIVMDIRMPVLSGVETYKKIKPTCDKNGTSVILVTAYAVENLIHEAVQEGVDSIMYKPLDIGQLLQRLDQVRDGSLVLLVDRDKETRDTVTALLETRGFGVTVATNPDEAVDIAAMNPQNLILIDHVVGLLDGIEIYEEIQQVNPNPTVLMIVDEGSLAGADIQRLNDGCHIVEKPLDTNILLDLVNRAVSARAG